MTGDAIKGSGPARGRYFLHRHRGLVGAAALLVALAAFASPAAAQIQWNPFKPGFGKPSQPAPESQRIPVAPPPPSVSAPPSGAARTAPTAEGRPSVQPAAPALATSAPLPPPRPTNLNGASAIAGSPAATPTVRDRSSASGVQAAAVEAAKVANQSGAYPAPANATEALARVNDWLNGFASIQARFVQHNAQGQKAEGALYVQRPGQLVFKYDPPSTLEIVADGKSVAVRDSKLRTNDVYSIGQTPLKFLVKDRVNLASDSKLLNVSTDAQGVVRVALSDSSTLGGTSKITLIFDSRANQLKQWNIVDPQGYETTVALYNLRATPR